MRSDGPQRRNFRSDNVSDKSYLDWEAFFAGRCAARGAASMPSRFPRASIASSPAVCLVFAVCFSTAFCRAGGMRNWTWLDMITPLKKQNSGGPGLTRVALLAAVAGLTFAPICRCRVELPQGCKTPCRRFPMGPLTADRQSAEQRQGGSVDCFEPLL